MADAAEDMLEGADQDAAALDAGEATTSAAQPELQADAAAGVVAMDQTPAEEAALEAEAAEDQQHEQEEDDGGGGDQLSFDYSGDEMEDADEVNQVCCLRWIRQTSGTLTDAPVALCRMESWH